jgi:hypothetical protein
MKRLTLFLVAAVALFGVALIAKFILQPISWAATRCQNILAKLVDQCDRLARK